MEYLQYKNRCESYKQYVEVLNLIINGIPSILGEYKSMLHASEVLNLIINGIPSIQNKTIFSMKVKVVVLNLIINGIPSIPKWHKDFKLYDKQF